jgi:hypothetical protein
MAPPDLINVPTVLTDTNEPWVQEVNEPIPVILPLMKTSEKETLVSSPKLPEKKKDTSSSARDREFAPVSKNN